MKSAVCLCNIAVWPQNVDCLVLGARLEILISVCINERFCML